MSTNQDRIKNRKYQKARRTRLKAEGTCCHCGKAPARENRTSCAECGAKKSAGQLKTNRRILPGLKKLKICLACKLNAAVPRNLLCGACQETHVESTMRSRTRKIK